MICCLLSVVNRWTVTPIPDVDVYDLQVNEWRSVRSLPKGLANLAAAAFDHHIYVAGGSIKQSGTDNFVINDLLYRYDSINDEWQELGRLPNPLAGAELIAGLNGLYLLGGWDGDGIRNEVWRYAPPAESSNDDPKNAEWILVTRMPNARAFFGAVIVNNEIYVAGGYDGQQEQSSVEVYALAVDEWRKLPPLPTPRGGLRLIYDGLAIIALGGRVDHATEYL